MSAVDNYPWRYHYYLRFDKINDFVEKVDHFYIQGGEDGKQRHFFAKIGVCLQIPFLLVESVACHIFRSLFHFTLGLASLDWRQFVYGVIDILSLVVEVVALPFIGLAFFFATAEGEERIIEGLQEIDNADVSGQDSEMRYELPDNLCYHAIALKNFSVNSRIHKITRALMIFWSYPKAIVDSVSNAFRFFLLRSAIGGGIHILLIFGVIFIHFVRPFLPSYPPRLPEVGDLHTKDHYEDYSYPKILGLDIRAIGNQYAPPRLGNA